MEHDLVQPALPEWVVPRETRARLDVYAAMVAEWSKTLNLVGRQELTRLWPRHIADCLQLVAHLPSDGVLADLGSGAGLPGLVLAIATGRRFHLIEADLRKAAFLREAARACAACVQIHAQRAETARLPPIAAMTVRAVASMPRLLELAIPHLAPGGIVLCLKGRAAAEELAQAEPYWQMQVQQWRSRTDAGGVILRIEAPVRTSQTGAAR